MASICNAEQVRFGVMSGHDRKTLSLSAQVATAAGRVAIFCCSLTSKARPARESAARVGPSAAFRQPIDRFAHGPSTRATLPRLAAQTPHTLACMHGKAWRGD